MEDSGYSKERFPNLTGEAFDCLICQEVTRNPKDCSSCGNMFCGSCIDAWKVRNE